MLDTVIMIPAARPSPIMTLSRLPRTKYPVVVMSDPRTYRDHTVWCKKHWPKARVRIGAVGLRRQLDLCYRTAHKEGVTWFRMDDDLRLPDNLFCKDGSHPPADYLIDLCRQCMSECDVSLVGPRNFKNQSWLGEGYGRSYSYLTGQAQLVCGSADPYADGFLDRQLCSDLEEEVYRCLAHRRHSGAVGVVRCVGIDSSMGYDPSDRVIVGTNEQWKKDINHILATFPGMVECKWAADGSRKFKMKRGRDFVP